MNGHRPPEKKPAKDAPIKEKNHNKIALYCFVFLAVGNLPTFFQNPPAYLIALVACFFLSHAIVKILF
ncbi:MAG: hypothetical protein GQ559_10375 [Desulfobulbaceae bacterium]|nr:hypothetical protein [Desulfobulbaceae bacterium]